MTGIYGASGRRSIRLLALEVQLRNLDFSSLRALLTTLLSLSVITLIGVGIRLLTQVTIQQRRERLNRQINERLRALIAAYKTLGGSFTGDLTVSPVHRRSLHQHAEVPAAGSTAPADPGVEDSPGADRARRIRDAVEGALSDIILLGTEKQVRLAATAAQELVTGKLVHTQELVLSLRGFIRTALDLEPIPADLAIPLQGPARPAASGGRDKGEGRQGGGSGEGGGGGGGMGGGGLGGGGGMGGGGGFGSGNSRDDEEDEDRDGVSGTHG